MPNPLTKCSECKFFSPNPGLHTGGECHALAPRPRPGSSAETLFWPQVSGEQPPCGDALPKPQ